MRKIKLKFDVWLALVSKLKECMRANRIINKQLKEYNEKFTKLSKEENK